MILDPDAVRAGIDDVGYALTPPLLTPQTCRQFIDGFEADDGYRSTVTMARHGYGRGRYRYFSLPLPEPVARLRQALYPPLAEVARAWGEDWPETHAALLDRCQAAGQTRPTPLILRYGPGDYNRLHQDLYGPLVFPLQVIVLLSDPADFSGGHLTLVETWPRQQSRCEAPPIVQGCGVVIPVRTRMVAGPRGPRRIAVRHGVTRVLSGLRFTLGIIFHDAV